MLAYFIDTSCPVGWADTSTDATYKGRLIKGTQVTPGGTFGTPSFGNSGYAHSHSSWSMSVSFDGSKRTSCPFTCSDKAIDDGASWTLNQGNSNMGQSSASIGGITLRLCRYTLSNAINLPPGIVTFFTQSVCPYGFGDYGNGNGRFLVFASAGKSVTSDFISGGPAATGSGSNAGSHGHYIGSKWFEIKLRRAAIGTGCCGPYAAPYYNGGRTLNGGWTDSLGMNYPYVQLRVCESTLATPGTLRIPHQNSIFYFTGDTCPALWREASGRGGVYGNIVGRLVYTVQDSSNQAGDVRGGSQLYCATGGCGAGHDGHSHQVTAGGIYFPAQGMCCLWDSCCGEWSDYRDYSFNFYTDSAQNALPYVALRACSPQADTQTPTKQPSRSPTTSRPTKSPTTSYPTLSPSRSPSRSPTLKPSNAPTLRPSSKSPTLAPTPPTSQRPTQAPTTLTPTAAPSHTPTSSPTNAPVWLNVCSTQDAVYYYNYDKFIVQAASCASRCRTSLFNSQNTQSQTALTTCVDGCNSFTSYTPLCRACGQRFIFCQDGACRGRCLSSFFQSECVTCSNTNCRTEYSNCTGFANAAPIFGGGDGSIYRPAEAAGNIGLIVGAALGSLVMMAGVVIAVRRFRDKRMVTAELQAEMDKALYKNGRSKDVGTATKGALFLGGMFGDKKGSNQVVGTAGVDEDDGTANPGYGHKSTMHKPASSFVYQGAKLRTRFSFHGTDADELDVAAGVYLTTIAKNDDWFVAKTDDGRIGLIPAAYVTHQ